MGLPVRGPHVFVAPLVALFDPLHDLFESLLIPIIAIAALAREFFDGERIGPVHTFGMRRSVLLDLGCRPNGGVKFRLVCRIHDRPLSELVIRSSSAPLKRHFLIHISGLLALGLFLVVFVAFAFFAEHLQLVDDDFDLGTFLPVCHPRLLLEPTVD